ncbi:hypothetical protein Sfulv_19400 [Streptomyces fulvorobeus]|nr:hypothetical protein Sfulv_19400 [Streptomyces fulvorobeus]
MKLVGDIAGGAGDLGGKLRDRFTGGGGGGAGAGSGATDGPGNRRPEGPQEGSGTDRS